jgi:hypothetical protein
MEKIGDYYTGAMSSLSWSRPNPIFAHLQKLSFSRDAGAMFPLLSKGAPILDYGAGSGMFSGYLKERGYDVHAADMYEPANWPWETIPFRQANLNGGKVQSEDVLCSGRIPEAVVLRHVFEHLYNPLEVIQEFRDNRVPYVLIVVPNVESSMLSWFGDNWYYWDPPRHLSFFSSSSLRLILQKGGYDVISVKTYGIDEIITSQYRRILTKATVANPGRDLSELLNRSSARFFQPKGLLAAVSSSASMFTSTVLWALGRLR